MKWMLLGSLIALIAPNCLGQNFSERAVGRQLEFEHFRPEILGAHPQNWAIVQDNDGLVYVGNNAGVLVFDGSEWSLVRTTNNSIVRSLAVGVDGTVFVGAKGELGYLEATASGSLKYKSLVPLLSDDQRQFDDVWNTFVDGENVFFVSPSQILIWDGWSFKSVGTSTRFHTAFHIDGKIIVREVSRGLVGIEKTGERFVLPEGEVFRDERVYSITRFGQEGDWLVATRDNGLYRYDGTAFSRLRTDADSILSSTGVYHGTLLPSGKVALATLGSGVLVLDETGHIDRLFGSGAGLPDLVVNHVYVDPEGGLWAVLNSEGVVRLDVMSPLSVFDRRNGLEGVIYGIAATDSNLFVVTGSGLFRSVTSSVGASRELARFEAIINEDLPFGISKVRDEMILLTQSGVEIYSSDGVQSMSVAKSHAVFGFRKDSVLVGHAGGLTLMTRSKSGRWQKDEFQIDLGDIRDIVAADDSRHVLVVTRDASVYRVNVVDPGGQVREIPYRSEKVSGEGADLVKAHGDVVIVSPNAYRIYRNRVGGLEIALDSSLVGADARNPIVTAGEDKSGTAWIVYKDTVCRQVLRNDACTELRSLSFPRETIGNIYFDGEIAWISSGNTLYRFDPRLDREVVPAFSPLVRRVSTIGSDSTLFLGHPTPNHLNPLLPYSHNDIHFTFAAPIYYAQDAVQYQFKLEGRDDDNDWAPWTKSTIAEYTNLREGHYTFRVKARNVYGFESPEGQFEFTILPPWYRTWWAYLLYVAGCAVVATLSVRYYRMAVAHRRAEEQAKELAAERVVNERLQHANERLKIANNRLVEVNALKDEFLATTSHELRTPITAIQGYAAILREELGDPHREFAEIIDKSSQRLMRTLNSVLDLAKLRSGTIEVNPAVLNLHEFVAQAVESAAEMASAKGLNLVLEEESEPVFVECDQYLLKNAILNILDNAIKFTESGSVDVSISTDGASAVINVSDEGVGIDQSFLPHIFDEFKQESDGLAREHSGTGLGLAITSLMVNAMGGSISIESEKGRGTDARIFVPIVTQYALSDVPSSAKAKDRGPIYMETGEKESGNSLKHPSDGAVGSDPA